jgi:hypothetical protein
MVSITTTPDVTPIVGGLLSAGRPSFSGNSFCTRYAIGEGCGGDAQKASESYETNANHDVPPPQLGEAHWECYTTFLISDIRVYTIAKKQQGGIYLKGKACNFPDFSQ